MGKPQTKSSKLKIVQNGNGRKKQRWAKGHSSDSNPTTKFHRDAARSRFYNPPSNSRELKMRDMKMLEKMDLNLDDKNDANSVGSDDTAATRLSNITNCTNPTFDKVHRIWKSGSKLHSDVLTILASVTDAIKAKGGKENEIEYFAALLNPLTDPEYSNNLVAATSYLLNLVIRKVPVSVLIQQFGQIADIIYNAIRKIMSASDGKVEMDSHDVAILRYLLPSLGYLLEILPKSFWHTPPYDVMMAKLLGTILEFIIHKKPRIRKSAQKVVVQIMVNIPTPPATASKQCAEFFVQQIENFGGDQRINMQADVTLHVLNLLQHVLHRFSFADLKKTTETIFKLLALSSHLTSTMAVHCMYMMFRNRPTIDSLSADLNAKIILAIYDFEPSPKDAKTCTNWILLITEAHACLIERDITLAVEYIPRLAETVARCLAISEHKDVINATVGALKKIYGDFVSDLAKSPGSTETLEKCLELLEKLISPQYCSIWPHIFNLFATFFEATGSNCVGLRNFQRCLNAIAELRESESFPCKLPAEQAIGSAIRHVGPEAVLAALPLGLNASSPSLSVLDFPRSWLLPLLRSKISGAQIAFFTSYFLPLAIKIDQRVKYLQPTGNPMEVKILEAIECQIWELFPAFCNRPTDVSESIPTIARALGAALTGRPKLRLSILSGLRKLLLENGSKEVVKYARNYLNILLQLYTSEKPVKPTPDYDDNGARLAVLETIRSYVAVAPPDLIDAYVGAVSEKLKIDDEEERKCRLMDILIVLASRLDSNQRKTTFELLVELMATAEHRLLKKCWRLMEELCGGNSEVSRSFVTKHLTTLQDLLQSNLTTAAPATKACRLRCLVLVLDSLEEPSDETSSFILAVLPDAISCLYGSSPKARKSAAKLVVKMVTVLTSWKKEINASLRLIFDKILAENRKQDTQELTGAIAAARLLCYEFRNDISADLLSFVLGKICHRLNNDDRRPVIQASIEFLKTFVGCFSEITVGQFLDTIISALCNQNEDCLKHCRRLTRIVVAKLVKRFSYVTVRKHVPDSFEKQLKNIRKLVGRAEMSATSKEERQKLKGTSVVSGIDDDTGTVFTAFTNISRPETIADLLKDTSDEDESDDEDDKKSRHRGSRSEVWLKEGDEDEVVDMMDKRFAQQILATKPQQRKSAAFVKPMEDKDRGFKTAADGRLVITLEKDDDDDDSELKSRKRKRRSSVESGGDGSVDMKAIISKQQHPHDDYEEDKDEEKGEGEGASTYVPGGKGIHRKLSEGKNGSKKAKGDKKSKDKVDPYAYVPMNNSALNKRKRAKLGGQFKHLVQGAKKGATKGSKGRKRQ